eukprot:8156249-Pyramimonas_sp.AAC.1
MAWGFPCCATPRPWWAISLAGGVRGTAGGCWAKSWVGPLVSVFVWNPLGESPRLGSKGSVLIPR